MNEFASERANSSEEFTAIGLLNLWVQALLGTQVRELQPACESFGGCFPGASIFAQLVNSRYLTVKVYPKPLKSQSIFSGSRKFTLRYR